MKINIFQKITFLIYTSIIILICVYFVPYHGTQNYLGPMMENHASDSSYHSHILDEGFGSMSCLRFAIYLFIPGFLFYFIFWYLKKMNSLEVNFYKEKAKRELYVFFLFISINVGMILFLYVKKEYSEFKESTLKRDISKIDNSFDLLRGELNKRPPFVYEILKDEVDEYGIKIIKPSQKLNLDLNVYYLAFLKNFNNVLKKTSNIRFSVIRRTQLEGNIKQLIYSKSSSEDLNKMIIDYVELFSKDGIKKTKFEYELKDLNFYNIKSNVVFVFLASFIILYLIRPLFSIFKGMLKEVR